jgi:pyridoxamine 5'-phosphate oxidase
MAKFWKSNEGDMSSIPAGRPFDPDYEAAEDPIELFLEWLRAAEATEPSDPNAMALATVGRDGHPSVRMVLMKGVDERGLAFYTNSESQKGLDLAGTPYAATCFHWKSQRRQVRVAGRVSMLTEADADRYFHSRSRGSQVGAAVSLQSRPLGNREELVEAAREFGKSHPGEIPRPPAWRGYALAPESVEFWQDGADRLHDRMVYRRVNGGWERTRLYP